MVEVMVVITFMVSIWVCGQATISLLNNKDGYWLSMPIGLSIVGLFLNILYFFAEFSFPTIKIIYACVVGLCLLVLVFRGCRLVDLMPLVSCVALFVTLYIPSYLGGVQYWVFRGNHWDHFNYIDQTLALAHHSLAVYKTNAINHFLPENSVLHGVAFLNLRPAVSLVFALLLPYGRADIHLLAFLFVTMLWTIVFPAATYAWSNLFVARAGGVRTKRIIIAIVPLAYCVGFWGQYIFDLNAWSEMASISIQLAFVFLCVDLIKKINYKKLDYPKGEMALVAILCAGGFVFYPENWIIQAILLCVVTVAFAAINKWRLDWRRLGWLVGYILVGLAVAISPSWRSARDFIINQYRFGSQHTPAAWAAYFDGYWSGQCSHVSWVAEVANFIVSFVGLFQLTATCSDDSLWMNIWQWSTISLAILIVIKAISIVFCSIFRSKDFDWLELFVSFSIPIFLFLYWKDAAWSLGKMLSYLSPYLFFVLCKDIIRISSGSAKLRGVGEHALVWGGLILVFVLIFGQFEFAVERIWKSENTAGIGYDPEFYPSIQVPDLKTKINWGLPIRYYAGCKGVYISDTNSPFVLEYLAQKLEYRNIPYFFADPVRDHFANGAILGYQKAIPYDCTLAARENSTGRWQIMSSLDRGDGAIYFASRSPKSELQGFGAPEPWGSWTIGPRSRIAFDRFLPASFTLELRVQNVFGPNVGKFFHISVGGQTHDVRMDSAGVYRIPFRDVELSNQVDIVIPSPTTPKSLGISGDERPLGVGLVSAVILPAQN